MFIKEIFCQRVSELRKSKGITQQALADAVGLKKQAINMIENGQRACSIEVLYLLAKYFEVSADYLLGLDILTYDKDGNPVIIEAMKPHSDKPDMNK